MHIYEYIYESESKGGPDKMIRNKRSQGSTYINVCMHMYEYMYDSESKGGSDETMRME